MNDIQMIVTDLDRTLLNEDKKISNYSIKILNKCMANGIKIVFATARPIRVTKWFYEYIMPSALICHNGAEVLVNDKVIYQSCIEPDIYNKIIEQIDKIFTECDLSIEIDDKIYLNFDPRKYWGIEEYKKIEDRPYKKADKVIIGTKEIEKINILEEILPEDVYLEMSEGTLILIMNKKASKINGIKKLQKYYNIKNENIITFGDDLNDLDMIKYYNGIAVENALDIVKNNAKDICQNNNNDGVTKWIEENILNGVRPNCT